MHSPEWLLLEEEGAGAKGDRCGEDDDSLHLVAAKQLVCGAACC